jgi:putative PIN family toxin of toxin-antitoxin system
VGKKTIIKVTLDTNILVSALGWDKGKPREILQKVVDREIELFISHEQFEELSRVLDLSKAQVHRGTENIVQRTDLKSRNLR